MSAQLKPLAEQVIVITGASSGIGLATAQMAAKRGAKVVLAARSDHTLADIVRQIQAQGGAAFAVCADVTLREDLERIASQAVTTFGRIDTWVNNAGVAIYGKLEDVPEQDSRKLFDINFWGVVNGSLIALPYLKQSKGALVNLGSEVSEAVVPLQGMYSASKWLGSRAQPSRSRSWRPQGARRSEGAARGGRDRDPGFVVAVCRGDARKVAGSRPQRQRRFSPPASPRRPRLRHQQPLGVGALPSASMQVASLRLAARG
jgi:hypothetical protein